MGLVRRKSVPLWGYVFVFFAAALWGTAAIAVKLLFHITEINAYTIGFFRLALAVPVLALAGVNRRSGKTKTFNLKTGAAMALVGIFIAASHITYYQAIRHTGVSITALVTCSTMPLMVVVLSVAAGHEKIHARLAASLALAIIGVGCLIGGPNADYSTPSLILGGFLSLASALSLALVTLTSKQLVVKNDPISICTLATGTAAILLAPVVFSSSVGLVCDFRGWLLLVYIGVGSTAVAYSIYFAGLKHIKASSASILALAEPLTAVLLAGFLFHEQLGAIGWAGAVMLIGAFLLICRER